MDEHKVSGFVLEFPQGTPVESIHEAVRKVVEEGIDRNPPPPKDLSHLAPVQLALLEVMKRAHQRIEARIERLIEIHNKMSELGLSIIECPDAENTEEFLKSLFNQKTKADELMNVLMNALNREAK